MGMFTSAKSPLNHPQAYFSAIFSDTSQAEYLLSTDFTEIFSYGDLLRAS